MVTNKKELNKMANKAAQSATRKSIAEGIVNLGQIIVDCAVLNDEAETTVFTLRTFETAIGMSRPKESIESDGYFLPSFMRQKRVKSHINNYLSLATFEPILFIPKRGGKAMGITVQQADKVMQGWIDAYSAGDLTKPQIKIAETMQAMKNAASASGFTQVIHEQLDYEDKRTRTISEVFNSIFEDEAHPWEHEFPLEYYELLYKVCGKSDEWRELQKTALPGFKPQTPSWVGTYTRDIIYARLKPAGVLYALEKKNPFLKGRGRMAKHHQYLTKEKGIGILQRHLGEVMGMMKRHKTWKQFYSELDEMCPIQDGQMRLDFTGEEKKKEDNALYPRLIT